MRNRHSRVVDEPLGFLRRHHADIMSVDPWSAYSRVVVVQSVSFRSRVPNRATAAIVDAIGPCPQESVIIVIC